MRGRLFILLIIAGMGGSLALSQTSPAIDEPGLMPAQQTGGTPPEPGETQPSGRKPGSVPVQGKSPGPDTTKPDTLRFKPAGDSVVYSADHIRYLIDEQKVVLFGDAKATYGNVKVEAETLVFDSKKKEITALGFPILRDGDQTIYGKEMTYNIETGYGEIIHGRAAIEKGWFEGKKTKKVGKNTLEIEDGSFTTCDREPPHTRFDAIRMKVYQNDMVICEPLLMFVGDVPVLFMPYWFFPIKKGRHTGFLLPKPGYDSQDGKYIKNLSYFLVLNDYSDLMFSADILEKKGLRSSVDGVYAVRPFIEGRVTGSYIDELETNRKRWRLEANHNQNFGWRTDLKARGDFQSDVNYETDYNENRIIQLNRRLESYASVSKAWSGASANLVLDRMQNLDTQEISELLPRASFSLNDRRIFEPPSEEKAGWLNRMRASFSALAVNSRQGKAGEYADRRGEDARLNLSVPLTIVRYVNANPSLSLRETVYGKDSTSTGIPTRYHYNARVGANTTVYGVSLFGLGPVERFRHVVKPGISYSYAPDVKRAFPSVPGIGGASGENSLQASLGNDFQAKLRNEKSSTVFTIASFDLSTSYDLRKKEKKLSDIASSFRAAPQTRVEFDVRMSHDPYDFKMKELSATARLSLGPGGSSSSKGWNAGLEGNYVRNIADRANDTYQLWSRIGFWPTEKWQMTYSQRYDVKEEKLVEQSLTLYRDLHEWEAYFEWETFGDRWRYDVRLNMKAIPEIKLGKGLFGIFLP
jgi:lipopolysaccharide export system protein LptA